MAQAISKLRPWTIYLGSYNALVSGACGWGSRYITLLPTQQILPSIMVGMIFSLSGVGTAILSDLLGVRGYICNSLHYPNQKNEDICHNILIAYYVLNFSFATFGALAFTPILSTLMKRSISYQAIAALSIINIFSTLILMKLLLKKSNL